MREIALHLLDIAENSVAAQAQTVTLTVCEDLQHDRLQASVQDDGKGMDAETVRQVVDPFFTSRTTRKVGLGIPLLKEAAEACNGFLSIQSALGAGTCLEVAFQRSHIDRMPLGDLAGSLLTLVVAYPQVRWLLDYSMIDADGVRRDYQFDTRPVLEALDGVPVCEPEVLAYLRETIGGGIASVRQYVAEY